jgi:RNA polymerase-binding transcription factor DksA
MAPEKFNSTKTKIRERFEAKAQAGDWKCSRCGKAITFEDRKAYLDAERCARCYEEMDSENKPVVPV